MLWNNKLLKLNWNWILFSLYVLVALRCLQVSLILKSSYFFCRRHIFEVPVPYCLNRLYRTDCPKDCSDEDTNQVCGSDGNIYRNECEMKKITCGWELSNKINLSIYVMEKLEQDPSMPNFLLSVCVDNVQLHSG